MNMTLKFRNPTYQRIKYKFVILVSMLHQNCKQRIKSIRQELKRKQDKKAIHEVNKQSL